MEGYRIMGVLLLLFIDISRKQSINRYNWLYLLGMINPNKTNG